MFTQDKLNNQQQDIYNKLIGALAVANALTLPITINTGCETGRHSAFSGGLVSRAGVVRYLLAQLV